MIQRQQVKKDHPRLAEKNSTDETVAWMTGESTSEDPNELYYIDTVGNRV
jgi:hypothetical protein